MSETQQSSNSTSTTTTTVPPQTLSTSSSSTTSSSSSSRKKKNQIKVMTKNREFLLSNTVTPHVHHQEEQEKKNKQQQMQNDEEEDQPQVIDECNIFVKYLPSDMTSDALQELFQQFGTITNCRVMVDNKTKSSLGYGFVRFSNSEEAKQAINKMSGYRIKNKKLLCKLSNTTPNQSPSLSSQSANNSNGSTDLLPSTNLFVRNFPKTFTTNDLEDIFKTYGPVSVIIMHDKDGVSKQMGFVRFEQLSDAIQAVEKVNGLVIEVANNDNCKLVVKYAETEQQKYERKQRQLLKMQYNGGMHAPYLMHQAPLFTPNPVAYYPMMYPQQTDLLNTSASTATDADSVEEQNEDLDETNGATQTPTDEHVSMSNQDISNDKDSTGVPSRSLIATSTEFYPHQVPIPQHYPYPYIPDSYLLSNFVYTGATPMYSPQSTTPQSSASDRSNTSPPGDNNQSYRIPKNNKSSGEDPNLFVFHLPSDVNDEALFQLFASFGSIESVKVITDRGTGESKGYGFVKYYNMDSAVQAISVMNGFRLGRKQLKVSFKTATAQLQAASTSTSSSSQNSSGTSIDPSDQSPPKQIKIHTKKSTTDPEEAIQQPQVPSNQ